MTMISLSDELEPPLNDAGLRIALEELTTTVAQLRGDLTRAEREIQTLQSDLENTNTAAHEALSGLNNYVEQIMGKDAIGAMGGLHNPGDLKEGLKCQEIYRNQFGSSVRQYDVNTWDVTDVTGYEDDNWKIYYHPEAGPRTPLDPQVTLSNTLHNKYRGVVAANPKYVEYDKLPRMWSVTGLRWWLDEYLYNWYYLKGELEATVDQASYRRPLY